jgi:hypothetical protein
MTVQISSGWSRGSYTDLRLDSGSASTTDIPDPDGGVAVQVNTASCGADMTPAAVAILAHVPRASANCTESTP